MQEAVQGLVARGGGGGPPWVVLLPGAPVTATRVLRGVLLHAPLATPLPAGPPGHT